jgi:hypothetical protein
MTLVVCQKIKYTKISTYTETLNSNPKMDSTVKFKHCNVSINQTCFLRQKSKQPDWIGVCQGVQNIIEPHH